MTSLADDYLDLDSLFSAEELELRDRVRGFVRRADQAEHRRLVRGRALPARDRQGAGRAGRARHAPDRLRLRRAAAPSSTGWRRWNWRPATPGCARSSACRARWR